MEELQLAEGGDDAGVDYIFEIPLKVAQSLVGFKHDENCAHLIGGVQHPPGVARRSLARHSMFPVCGDA
jgi:hypothetical protein